MWIHIIVFLSFCVLFSLSKGFFSKAGAFLAGILPDFFQLTGKQISLSLLIIFLGNLLGCGFSLIELMETDTVQEGYLIRNQKGEGSYEEELIASDGENEVQIPVVVEPVPYSQKEINNMLENAVEQLDTLILGENKSFQKIEYPMNLVTEMEDSSITIEWNTSQPVYLDWEGNLGDEIPEEGISVLLTGELYLDENLRTYEKELKVYPEKLSEEEAFIRELKQEVRAIAEEEGEKQYLPEMVNGAEISWSRIAKNNGWIITGLSVLIGLLLVFGEKSRIKESQILKSKEMLLDYPLLINKLMLFMRAGISSRQAIRRIVKEYQDRKKKGQETAFRPAYEELSRMYYEMEHGVSEETAYERFGNRCGLMEYRTLSTLLVQNLKKGSNQFLSALEKECRQAFDERKKRALIAGEEAGTKLLIPMVMMLILVLMIIMVPSFLVF